MDMVSESGAITDVNEIAAAVGLDEDQVNSVLQTALEELADTLQDIEDVSEEEMMEMSKSLPAFESLCSVATCILESGSISRSDANTLMSATTSLEGFEKTFAGLPLNSYTEMPSKVNFDVSMENIFKTILTKIIEACKKLVEAIRNWFTTNSVKTSQAATAEVKVEAKLAQDIKKIDRAAVVRKLDEIKTKYTEKSPLMVNKFFLITFEKGQLNNLMAAFEPYLTTLLRQSDHSNAHVLLNEACDKVMNIYGVGMRQGPTVLDPNKPDELALHKLLSISEGFRTLAAEQVQLAIDDLPALLSTIENSVKAFSARPSLKAFSLWKRVYSVYVESSRDKLKEISRLNKEGDVAQANSIYDEVRKTDMLCLQLRQMQTIRMNVMRTKVNAAYFVEKINQYITDLEESVA